MGNRGSDVQAHHNGSKARLFVFSPFLQEVLVLEGLVCWVVGSRAWDEVETKFGDSGSRSKESIPRVDLGGTSSKVFSYFRPRIPRIVGRLAWPSRGVLGSLAVGE